MLRTIGGVLAGIVAAVAVIWGVEMISHMLYPIPRSVSIHDREGLGAFLQSLPIAAQLIIACGWFLGAALGGAVASRISGRPAMAWVVAGLVLVSALANILFVSHPVFLMVAALVAPLLGGLVAARLGRRGGAAAGSGRIA